MGRAIKLKVDKSIDREYPEGSRVMFIQQSLTTLGIVSFQAQAPLYDYYADLANSSFKKSFKLRDKVLELPIDKRSGFRELDEKLLAKIYTSGSCLVMNSYLLLEHFSRYALASAYLPGNEKTYFALEDKELKEKIKHIIVDLLDNKELLKEKGYGVMFSDFEKIRHAINHPKFANIYSADKNKWDSVPIAWFVAGKHVEAFHDMTVFYTKLLKNWHEYARKNQRPGTITNLQPIVSGVYAQPKKVPTDF